MSVSVHLDFVPPNVPGMAQLRVYESPDKTGPWTLIDQATDVGVYGNYISEYSTDQASSLNHWFAIEWVDDKGATSPMSNPIQGGTSTLLGEIVQRVMLRDPNVNELVVLQEAQAALEDVFGATWETLKLDDATAKQLSGLTLLTLARVYMSELLVSQASGFTAGMVSVRSSETSKSRLELIQSLIAAANEDLGLNYSIIFQMPEIDRAGMGAIPSAIVLDQSRLLMVSVG